MALLVGADAHIGPFLNITYSRVAAFYRRGDVGIAPYAYTRGIVRHAEGPAADAAGPCSLLGQQFRDLDAVGGSALADLVAAAPEAEAIFVGQVGTDTSHIDDVLAGGIQRHGVLLVGQVIHQLHAGGILQHLPGLLHGDGTVEMHLLL